MLDTDEPLAALAAGRQRWSAHLADFVSIPSVSGEPRHAADVRRAAAWLRARLHALGMPRAALVETPGHPIVWAEWRSRRPAPTVLIYGHYDVVAPGPAQEWRSPPFAPVERGGLLYGRGASDDKGPLSAQLAALEAWLAGTGRLPVNVTCLYEGEEEIGSVHLRRLIAGGWRPASQVGLVKAAVISDTRILAPDYPALIVGLRGSLAAEVEIAGSARDVHSGAFGGAIRNPAHVLCELLATLHDRSGRVAIAGFYDDVRPPAWTLRDGLAERMTAAQIVVTAGRQVAFGERGFSAYERTALRPALDVNGLSAGHTGPGGKGIVPARALAKLSFRLVPAQDPHRVAVQFRRHLALHAPPGVRARAVFSKPATPVTIDPRRGALQAARAALRAGFGRAPALLFSGGTIPVVEQFAACIGDPVLMGFALADDGMHGPNERVHLGALAAGARSLVHFLSLIARPGPGDARLWSDYEAREAAGVDR
jgi:acetylornithine deacetylase/succinyl-diaminopimelate desuccinylase-like protein